MGRERRCETCEFWRNGGPGRDVCAKPLTKEQKTIVRSLPAAYTVLGGQVHAQDGTQCKQWVVKKVPPMSAGQAAGGADRNRCPLTQHIDGKSHGWVFDGDDPYVLCAWCHERRDALTDRVIK